MSHLARFKALWTGRKELRIAIPLLAVVGCSSVSPPISPEPGPGTGDIAFRLSWMDVADLDLHVTDPAGEEIYHLRRTSDSGGQLDVDCNGERRCSDPIENIFWQPGTAPEGMFRVVVDLFRRHRWTSRQVPFRLEALVGETVVHNVEGEIVSPARCVGPLLFGLRRGLAGPRVTFHELHPTPSRGVPAPAPAHHVSKCEG